MGQVVSLSQLKPDQFGGPTQTGPTLRVALHLGGISGCVPEGSQFHANRP